MRELKLKGQNIREAYQRRLPSNTAKDYYFIQRDTGSTQPIIVEYGFLDSTGDDVLQLQTDVHLFAEAVVKAVMEYLRLPYKDKTDVNTYIVKSGDSLWGIAKKYGLDVAELKEANNLTGNLLSIGQTLKLPILPLAPETGDYIVYVVKENDSLYKIGRKYNVSVDDLIDFNSLLTTNLKIGQQILIPTFESNSEEMIGDYVTYVVKNGDTLYAIARENNISLEDIMKYNGLTTNLLSVGQRIRIPKAVDSNQVDGDVLSYVVKPGDNLYAIARRYGITELILMEFNGLNNDLLSIGQIIKIPKNSNNM